jgi:adapter protein MecA 1/2
MKEMRCSKMEMERINDNTIRVSIGNEDLAERGITFLDLLGNQKQIESFFYSILEEVDVDEQFQETDSVTFQVLPNQDGLELFISKNLPLDDMENIEGMEDNLLDKEKEELIDEEIDMVHYGESIQEAVFRLDNFEALIVLAKNIKLHNVLTYLYQFKDEYYLRVSFFSDEKSEGQMKNDYSQIYEYAHRTNVTTDILEEYGEMIMERNALELTRYYFK